MSALALVLAEGSWGTAWSVGAIGLTAAAEYALLLIVVNNPIRRAKDDSFKRLEQHGRRLAIYDRETGLYAQWYFALRLEEEVARSKNQGETFGLLLVESLHARLDAETEKLLIERLRNGFRGSDLVAHIGNLRFVVLLATTDHAGAQVVFQRLVREPMPCPVQVGLAMFPDDGVDWRSLIEAAESRAEITMASAA